MRTIRTAQAFVVALLALLGPMAHADEVWVMSNQNYANSATGNSSMPFYVSVQPVATTTVTVEYTTIDSTAVAGRDYVAVSGSLTFLPGEVAKMIPVTILGKTSPHPDRQFYFVLSNSVGAPITAPNVTGFIGYYDYTPPQVQFYVDDPFIAEGHAGTTLLGFTVSASSTPQANLTVDYATSDATALAGVDYTARSGTLTFRPGQNHQWVLVPVPGNSVVDGNRSLTVTLSNPSTGTAIAKATGTGTIVDDDPAVPAPQVPMYRLYHNSTKEHLYTTDANEYSVLGPQGWVQEGIAYKLFGGTGFYGGQFTTPLYRMYHPNIFQHHWTTDANEVMTLAGQGIWRYEGIPGYVLPGSGTGTAPLYRLMYAYPPLHLWTTDANEKNVLSSQYGWAYEGVVGEVLP